LSGINVGGPIGTGSSNTSTRSSNTSVFSSHARAYQALSGQAAAFHAQFVQALSGAGASYAAAEAANASPLQTLQQDVLARDQRAHQRAAGTPADR
jgi:fermentation-respiration switch protein FrsA (DUF1100 family)